MSVSVFESLEEVRGRFGPCAVAIGNFDGVHIGHQALLAKLTGFVLQNALASQNGPPSQNRLDSQNSLTPAVLTFHPHPTVVVAPHRTPPMICTLDERIQLLAAAGAERILILPFTEQVAALTPEEFVWQILVNALDTKAVFVGENFRFGCKQAGTAATLASLGDKFGFVSQFVQPVTDRGEIVSSSAVRTYLKKGNVSRAGRLLGRCFAIEGPVVSGQGVGSKQTVPTLNLRPIPGQILPRGVFITETLEPGPRQPGNARHWPSITNVGVRPTFGGDEVTIETYLLRPLDGPAPERIRVRFRHFVRAERPFPDPEALKSQILKDVGRAQAYWRRLEKLAPSIQ